MFCFKCGAEIPDDSEFCMKCGAKMPCTIPAEPNNSDNLLNDTNNELGCTNQEQVQPTKRSFFNKLLYGDNPDQPSLKDVFNEAKNNPPKYAEAKAAKERIKENKKNGIACCPKCGSTSLSSNKQGFGIGKAIIGARIAKDSLGLVAGNINSKKIHVTCLNCGHKWKM